MRDILGKDWDKIVVKSASYETTDPTIDSQIVELQSCGRQCAAGRRDSEVRRAVDPQGPRPDWKPMFFMTNVAISVGGVLTPAGPEKADRHAEHAVSEGSDRSGLEGRSRHEAMARLHGQVHAGRRRHRRRLCVRLRRQQTMLQVLKQCKGDFSRANVMKQAESLHDFELPVLLPGIKINTTHTDHRPISSMQLVKWDGKTWAALWRYRHGCNRVMQRRRGGPMAAPSGDRDAPRRSTVRGRPARRASRARAKCGQVSLPSDST